MSEPMRENEASLDRATFWATLLLLTCFGVVAIHTSSVTTRQVGFEPIYLSKHLAHLGLAGCVLLWASTQRATLWRRLAVPVGVVVLGALALVAVPGMGQSAGGATRWLRVPGFSIQPSEWAKLAVPMVAAWWLTGERTTSRGEQMLGGLATRFRLKVGLKRTAFAGGLVLAMVALVMKQPDLGTSLLLVAAAVTTLWYGGFRLRWFLLTGVATVPVFATLSLKGYQLRRISGLIDTWRDWRDAPYQLRQSLIALGEGGTTGVGLGQGWQKLSFLPESHTDFVVAVVGEELGLIGVAVLGLFWMTLLMSGLSMARRCPDRFTRTVASSLLTMVVLQAALNVAVVAAVIPPTGIPHPLLSYGGNSLLVTAFAIGIVASMTRDLEDSPVLTSDTSRLHHSPTPALAQEAA